jgi:hypothetical protein
MNIDATWWNADWIRLVPELQMRDAPGRVEEIALARGAMHDHDSLPAAMLGGLRRPDGGLIRHPGIEPPPNGWIYFRPMPGPLVKPANQLTVELFEAYVRVKAGFPPFVLLALFDPDDQTVCIDVAPTVEDGRVARAITWWRGMPGTYEVASGEFWRRVPSKTEFTFDPIKRLESADRSSSGGPVPVHFCLLAPDDVPNAFATLKNMLREAGNLS